MFAILFSKSNFLRSFSENKLHFPCVSKYATAKITIRTEKAKHRAVFSELLRDEYGCEDQKNKSFFQGREHSEDKNDLRTFGGNRTFGRWVSARSLEKYAEAVRLYETTREPLRAIARRLGLVYNSLSGFIRRNCPEAVARRRA